MEGLGEERAKDVTLHGHPPFQPEKGDTLPAGSHQLQPAWGAGAPSALSPARWKVVNGLFIEHVKYTCLKIKKKCGG